MIIQICKYIYAYPGAAMRWLQLVASWKLQVSFAKETYKRDYILQKRLHSAKETYNHAYMIGKYRFVNVHTLLLLVQDGIKV